MNNHTLLSAVKLQLIQILHLCNMLIEFNLKRFYYRKHINQWYYLYLRKKNLK